MSVSTTSIVAFTLAAALLTVTPGLDTALVLRTAAVEGGRRAALAGAGICTGVFVWGALVALGLGALLARSSSAATVVRWAGAAYLVWLGLTMLRRPRAAFVALADGNAAAASRGGWYVRGLLTNLLNPKVGVFYLTFLPQFVPPQAEHPAALMLLFAAIHAVEGVLWFALLIIATASFARVLRRPAVVRLLDRAMGVLLVGFGVRLALDPP